MGQITEHGVYSPDADDTVEPDVYLATMAASINNGIGNRVQALETYASCKLGLDAIFAVPGASNVAGAATVPVKLITGYGSFIQSMTNSTPGIVTVSVAGTYIVTAAIGATNIGSRSLAVHLLQNAVVVAESEVPTNASYFISAQTSCVIQCKAGDTISMKARSAGSGSINSASNQGLTYLSVALVQTMPVTT